ncbi:Pentatricopeptide repeat-containing protein [Durusdinium trenchii]|uniref:Chloroplastic n=1 Tax=Durusdinium trenchii TaxID=1381693 RepID=A0ABP0RI37_9DINO
MGAAVWKAAQGQTEDTKAAYAWDEAAAFYVGNVEPVIGDGYTGSVPGNLYSPYEFNWKRDFDFPDGTSTHTEAIPILNYGLLNIRGGDYNATNLAAAQMAIYKIIAINAIRSAIKYSNRAYNGGDFQPKYLAEGWAYWKTGSGYLDQIRDMSRLALAGEGYIATVNKAVVQQVDALLALNLKLGRDRTSYETNTTFASDADCQIKQLVESIYADLGITCAMVGMWKDATANSCLAAACDDTGNSGTLISGSQAGAERGQAQAKHLPERSRSNMKNRPDLLFPNQVFKPGSHSPSLKMVRCW